MLNVQEVRDHWETIQSKLKEKWGQLTDEDLQIFNDNLDQVIGRIQERIGAERRAVEDFLQRAADAAPSVSHLKRAAKESLDKAAENAREGYETVSQRVHEGYETAEQTVRSRPLESIATTFLAGLLTGLFVGMVIRNRDE